MAGTALCTYCKRECERQKLRNCLPVPEKLCTLCTSRYRHRELHIYVSPLRKSFHPFTGATKTTVVGFERRNGVKVYTEPVLAVCEDSRSPERPRRSSDKDHTLSPRLFGSMSESSRTCSRPAHLRMGATRTAPDTIGEDYNVMDTANSLLASADRLIVALKALTRENNALKQRVEELSRLVEKERDRSKTMEIDLERLKKMESSVIQFVNLPKDG